jgi:hypothetical protein
MNFGHPQSWIKNLGIVIFLSFFVRLPVSTLPIFSSKNVDEPKVSTGYIFR